MRHTKSSVQGTGRCSITFWLFLVSWARATSCFLTYLGSLISCPNGNGIESPLWGRQAVQRVYKEATKTASYLLNSPGQTGETSVQHNCYCCLCCLCHVLSIWPVFVYYDLDGWYGGQLEGFPLTEGGTVWLIIIPRQLLMTKMFVLSQWVISVISVLLRLRQEIISLMLAWVKHWEPATKKDLRMLTSGKLYMLHRKKYNLTQLRNSWVFSQRPPNHITHITEICGIFLYTV